MAYAGIRMCNGLAVIVNVVMFSISLYWTINYSQYTTFPLTVVVSTWIDCRKYAHEGTVVVDSDKISKMKSWCVKDEILANRQRATSFPELTYGNVNMSIILCAMYALVAILHTLFTTVWWKVYEEQLENDRTLAERWGLFSYITVFSYALVAYFCGMTETMTLVICSLIIGVAVFIVYFIHLEIIPLKMSLYPSLCVFGLLAYLLFTFLVSNWNALTMADTFVWLIMILTIAVFSAIGLLEGYELKRARKRNNKGGDDVFYCCSRTTTTTTIEYAYLILEILFEIALGTTLMITVFSSSSSSS